ncbi:3-deoxy-manno-octulosonate cytidylyltransferase [Algiphilus aromaticivorans]|uniref:3-deoxy-manno-octulosonate cytidylyltransferase n=1 Tax=Algiphilus aromaticivorans TaxID=382454 RepID=UPI0005C1BCA6|nr:3-deoxy-manno-octulosonate cytidylyltransferase [Algiphilus aromaticivorans]
MSADFDVVIPARLGSTRLPGKVLADIGGRPLIAHVYDRAVEAGARSVVIAADNERVVEACRAFGADVQLTSPMHHSGTDRVHEVATARGWKDDRCIVNLQGDEPMMPPEVVAACASKLVEDPEAAISTCAHALSDPEAFANPNVVKVVCDARDRALYFSRARIPFPRDADGADCPESALRHIGVYGYRVAALRRFASLRPGILEALEALEQLRALEQGMPIAVARVVAAPGRGVDTEADLESVRALLAGD